MDVFVVGVGNPWALDDGVGVAAVRRLQSEYIATSQLRHDQDRAEPPQITFLILPQPAVELIELMNRCKLLIVVDAVQSGAPPGTIHHEVWQPHLTDSRGVERASSHGLGIGQVLNLAAALKRLPEQVILWGVEIASTEPGPGLSPDVAAAVPCLVDRLCQALAAYPKKGEHCLQAHPNERV